MTRAPARTAPAAPRGELERASGGQRPSVAAEIAAHAGDPNFMASLARGLAVIRAFAQQRTRLSTAQLSLRTGIPRAAVRRVLYTLCALGYAGTEDGRTFLLHPQILALGYAYLSSMPLAASAQPLLDQVSRTVHESCSMSVLDGDDVLYVARASTSQRIMSIDLGIGSRLPAYCTSMGRVLLANLAPTDLAAYLRRVKLLPLTPRTELSKDALAGILQTIRTKGYAVVDQELEIGLRSIAVPVVASEGRVAAALNVGTQAARVTISEMEKRFLPVLRAAARDLGMLLR
ncbi:MAG TPA: IclR family transcriptional regulator C-terminal domain-containing protein [Casimicrobiaceae bacterium]|nr:IclR family transcriptional regulator C-terminal domain-containing protein [Casimicrobiaceae bacterium]